MEGPLAFVSLFVALAAAQDSVPGTAGSVSRLPLAFVENAGQWDGEVAFRARRGGMTLDAGRDGFLLRLVRMEDEETVRGANLRFAFEGKSAGSRLGGRKELPGTHNFFLGEDPGRWRSGLRGFGKVAYEGVWDGVDLVVRESGQDLEYDLFLASGADLERVALRVEGATGPLRLDESGALLTPTALGEVRQPRPAAWVEMGEGRIPVEVRFRVLGEDRFGFGIEGTAPAGSLVVDPGLVYSTFLGGSGTESIRAVAVSPSGEATVVGSASLTSFPTTPGAFSTTAGGGSDVVVTRLSANGASLVYSTYLGGSGGDTAQDVGLDSFDQPTVVGWTTGPFPTTPGAYDTTANGFQDIFVTRLSANGASLVYSTVLGGSATDTAPTVFVDAFGIATLAGITTSPDYPTTPGAADTTPSGAGIFDAIVTCVGPTGATLPYSTVLGGGSGEYGGSVAVDAGGVATLVGSSFSPGLATPGAFDTTNAGGPDAFVARIPLGGGPVLAFTYLGGTSMELGWGAAHDGAGLPTVAGYSQTLGTGFPTTTGPFGTGDTTFVTRFDPTLASLVYSTQIGGTMLVLPAIANQKFGFALDSAGAALVGGAATIGLPVQAGGYDPSFNGAPDGFVVKLSPAGTAIQYATYLGDVGGDQVNGLALTPSGGVVVAGETVNSTFPTTSGAYDTTYNFGFNDGFVASLDLLPDGVFTFGDSTPGCGGALIIGVSSAAQLGNASFAVTCSNGPPIAPGVLGFSAAKFLNAVTIYNLGVWIDFLSPAFFVVPTATDGVGAASVPFAVPNNLALVGIPVYAQFAFLGPNSPSPPCPASGLSCSGGLEINAIP